MIMPQNGSLQSRSMLLDLNMSTFLLNIHGILICKEKNFCKIHSFLVKSKISGCSIFSILILMDLKKQANQVFKSLSFCFQSVTYLFDFLYAIDVYTR